MRGCTKTAPGATGRHAYCDTCRVSLLASPGGSVDFFSEHVQHDLKLVRRGRLVLVPVKELERWVERNAARTIEP
jgi:hypothetical protein